MAYRYIIAMTLQMLFLGSARAEPALFWFNDPVGPDETVLVTGADLNEITSASVVRLADQGTAASSPELEVEILQANPQSLKFVIPQELAAGIYRFTLHYAQGTLIGRVNLPSVY